MSNICIFPKDVTTGFLKPVSDELRKQGYVVFDGDTREDGYAQSVINIIPNYECVVFLGHGSSTELYGSALTSFLGGDNMEVLRGKKMFLLACNSGEFLDTYSLTSSIGFGDIPTGNQDVCGIIEREWDYFESIPNDEDIKYFQSTIVRIIMNSFVCGSMSNMDMLANKIKMFTNRERYDCLRKHKELHYRDILKMLYDFKENMIYIR